MHLVPLLGRGRGRWFSAARSREFVTVRPRRCVTLVWNVPALGSDPELSRRRRAERASSARTCLHTMSTNNGAIAGISTRRRSLPENLAPASKWTGPRPRAPSPGTRGRGLSRLYRAGQKCLNADLRSRRRRNLAVVHGRPYRPGRHRTRGCSDVRCRVRAGIAWHRNWCTERTSYALGTLILRVPSGIRNETGSYDSTPWILSACIASNNVGIFPFLFLTIVPWCCKSAFLSADCLIHWICCRFLAGRFIKFD